MKRNVHFIVPANQFRITRGEDDLTLYQFNKKIARHLFCKICGVQAFYVPRSNPEGVAITVACIDEGTLEGVMVVPCDGANWEAFVGANRERFAAMSRGESENG